MLAPLLGRSAEDFAGVMAAGLLYAYCNMFDCFGIYTPRFDSIDSHLPIGFFKLNLGKYISFIMYLIYISIAFYAYAILADKDPLEILSQSLQAFSLIFLLISSFGKVKYLSSKDTFLNMPNIVYLLLAAVVLHFLLTSTVPDDPRLGMLTPDSEMIKNNLLVLTVMIAADFITYFLNRNKIARV